VDHSYPTWRNSNDGEWASCIEAARVLPALQSHSGTDSACVEPARNPLTRLGGNNQDSACVQRARNPLVRQSGDRPAASLGSLLRALING
jgi:hypothetical protein